jgi:hypothetical protein
MTTDPRQVQAFGTMPTMAAILAGVQPAAARRRPAPGMASLPRDPDRSSGQDQALFDTDEDASSVICRRLASWVRARLTRLLMVPTAQPQMPAASS